MSTERLLTDVIDHNLEILKEMEVGNELYKSTVDSTTKLIDRMLEIDKFNTEYSEKIEARETEQEIERERMEQERKDRKIKNIISAVSIGGGFVLTVWGTIKSLKFEETGTVTSTAGRKFLNNLFLKK
jgi:hypothetical protein